MTSQPQNLTPSSSADRFETINPATGECVFTASAASAEEIEATLARAEQARRLWPTVSIEERARVLTSAAGILRSRAPELAKAISVEMGKPLGEALAEVEKSAWNCEFVAEHGPGWLAEKFVEVPGKTCSVRRRPGGVLLAIMPWNFPVWQVFRFAPAALMAGNAIILKHAPNVQGSAQAAVEILEQAGLPEGVFQNLRAPVESMADIIRDARVRAVTLTGSARAGAAVGAVAGGALKKTVLELGGSDPFIVMEDADLEAAVEQGVKGRYANCGQVCLAPKRFILDRKIADRFIEMFKVKVEALKVGNPLDNSVDMGPMAREDLRAELDRQVELSVKSGAEAILGGTVMGGAGVFYAPTILTKVEQHMPIASQEAFGPVAAMMVVDNQDEMAALANASQYGLSSNIWTADVDRALAFSEKIETGGVFINSISMSDPRLPVGGVKASGYGRELGPWGFDEFVNIQSVSIGGA